tara:strand:+ start:51 stop:1769 length:1719 start_codon:yes stop_codon:yes gene_type:complete
MSEKSAKAARRDRELIDALAAMNTNFGSLLAVTKAANKKQEENNKKVVDKLSKLVDEKKGEGGGDSDEKGSFKEFAKKMPVIAKILRTGFSDMKKTFNSLMKLQEKALARGENLGSIQEIGPKLTGLTDSLTNLEVNFAGWSLGLRTNSKEVGSLVLQSKLTGGNYKALAKSLARNTAGMGMSDAAIGNLAKHTQGLSQGFKISVDELSTAMDGLGKDLDKFAALGIGADMQAATAALAAGLGPEMAQLAPDIVKAMTAGSNMVQMAMLDGGDHVREILEGGGGPQDVINALLHMGDRAKEISKQYTEGAAHSMFALEQFSKVHGKDAEMLMRAADAFRENAKRQYGSVEAYTAAIAKEKVVNDEFTRSWDNFKNKIFEPMRLMMMRVSTIFLDLMVKMEPYLGAMGAIAGAVVGIGGIALIMKSVGLSMTFLKAMGVGMRFAGMGGSAGAPGVAAFGAALATVALQVALIAAAIGVAGAGLGILFHGFEGIGGGSSGAQSSVTSAAGRGSASSYESTRIAAENSRVGRENQNLLRQLVDNTDRTAVATIGVGHQIRRSTPRGTIDLPYKDI